MKHAAKELDAHDRRLLESMPDKRYAFTKGSAQASRAHDLWNRGLLERKESIYKMSAGGTRVEIRSAYRRTQAGRDAIGATKGAAK